MDISKEDSKKRGRSETSVIGADTSLLDDSKDSRDVNPSNPSITNTSKEASLKDSDSKDYNEDLDKGKTNKPKYVMKSKGQPQSHKQKVNESEIRKRSERR